MIQGRKEQAMATPQAIIDTDVAIIGAGTAGLAAYRAVKNAGKRALLIEGGEHGTTCARVGCMPSKLLIAPADAAHAVARFPAFGMQAVAVNIDRRAVMERVRRERDRFVAFVTDDVGALPDADKVDGLATFVNDRTLRIDDRLQVKASGIVIAYG
jgi:dihydrolipoamide dehydrogenase